MARRLGRRPKPVTRCPVFRLRVGRSRTCPRPQRAQHGKAQTLRRIARCARFLIRPRRRPDKGLQLRCPRFRQPRLFRLFRNRARRSRPLELGMSRKWGRHHPFRPSRRRRRHKLRQSQTGRRPPLAALPGLLPTRADLRPCPLPRQWLALPRPDRRPRGRLPQFLLFNRRVLVRRLRPRTPPLPNRMCWPLPCAGRRKSRLLASLPRRLPPGWPSPTNRRGQRHRHRAIRVRPTSQAFRHKWLRVWRNSPAFLGHQNPTVLLKRTRSRRRKAVALRLPVRRTWGPSEHLRMSQRATRSRSDEALLRRGLRRSPDVMDRSRSWQRRACTSIQHLG